MKPPSPNIRALSPVFSFKALPGGIWALGFVSMFMNISSELVHSLLPVFMATILGTSLTTIGLIEGIAEATAAITFAIGSSFSLERYALWRVSMHEKKAYTISIGCLGPQPLRLIDVV